jgi:2-oxoglutarate dehydrogenase E2 component (dihydrolipoamide succinyltransferase)
MSIPVKLPALGESVVEGTVSRWLVRPGDAVAVDQTLCEVTTDKVDAEIPSPVAGVVVEILVPEDAIVEVGTELALIRETSEAGSGSADASDDAVARAAAETAVRAVAEARSEEGAAGRATPVARRLAERAELSLDEIRGTGSGGRVTKSDVLAHAEAPRSAASPAQAARFEAAPDSAKEGPGSVVAGQTPALPQLRIALEEGDRVVRMSPQRRAIAAHMVYSKHTSPHVGTVAEVDLGAVTALRRARAEAFRSQHGASLTLLPFIAHSVARALREFPALNASVTQDAIVERHGVHLGVAVETDKGLLVPVVRNADRLSPTGMALAIAELSERARTRRIGPDDLRGGTFTVSNPGRTGNLYGFAIINQPQVGILRMGELVKRPVVRTVDGQDAIVIRPTMHLALSYDHRAVDGARANGFLFRIRELLEAGHFDL